MNRWYGKLLGLVAGALLFRPNPLFGAVVGLLLGHAFDSDWFRLRRHDDPWAELGLTDGAQVKVSQDGGSAVLNAVLDASLPANVVRVPTGHPLTASLGAAFGTVRVDKA